MDGGFVQKTLGNYGYTVWIFLLFRYDLDGIFEATPGCRRAVHTAVSALQSHGHRVIPFRPPHLLKAMRVNTLYRAGDLGARHQAQLAIGPVCTKAFGLKHLCRIIPKILRSTLATGNTTFLIKYSIVRIEQTWAKFKIRVSLLE